MKVVILCGGQGTRISNLSSTLPKPMISIGDMPIIWHIMKYYSCFNIKDFVLCLGYKSDVIKDFFVNYKQRKDNFTLNLLSQKTSSFESNNVEDWNITFAETGLNALTGARVKRIQQFVETDETFMLTYGDGLGNIDINELLKFHKSHGKLLTVTGVHPPGRFGELNINGNQVVGFNEKPQTRVGWISGGFFVCNKKFFDYFNDNEDLILEREPMENVVKDGQLMIYKHDDFWLPMDTPREYSHLNDLWLSNKSPWKIWE